MLSLGLIIFGSICGTFFLLLLGLYVYGKLTIGICHNKTSLKGKTVLITGGNSGIGLEAAKEFARRGAKLLLPCRDQKKGRRAIADMINETGNNDLYLYSLDTSSLESVENLVQELLKCKGLSIDVLCLNAGRSSTQKREESVDGHELVFATNHLGHFHLTNLIREMLAPSARIILTSSLMYEFVRLDFKDLELRNRYSRLLAYGSSKLMNIYHMRELSVRLSKYGITVNAFHPGLVRTPILRGPSISDWIFDKIIAPIYGKTPWQGAQTLIYLATSEKLEGVTGYYFVDCKPRRINEVGNDKKSPRKLWEYCEGVVERWQSKRLEAKNGKVEAD